MIRKFQIPKKKINDFVYFIKKMDIEVILSYSIEGFIDDISIVVYCFIQKTDIPAELKEEKIRESWQQYLIK